MSSIGIMNIYLAILAVFEVRGLRKKLNTSTTRENKTQHEYNISKTHNNTSTIRHKTSITRPNTSTKKVRAAKIKLYFTPFVTELYIFLICFRNCSYSLICNIVFAIPLNTKDVYIRPSEMLLSNQARMTFCAKIAIQVLKTYIYPTPLSSFFNNNYSLAEN